MGIKHVILCVPLVFLMACGSSSTDIPEGYTAKSGQEIYTNRCVVCHGVDGKLMASGAKDLSISTMDSTGIVNMLQNGGNGMPRQKQFFTVDEEYGNVVTYVKSLRK